MSPEVLAAPELPEEEGEGTSFSKRESLPLDDQEVKPDQATSVETRVIDLGAEVKTPVDAEGRNLYGLEADISSAKNTQEFYESLVSSQHEVLDDKEKVIPTSYILGSLQESFDKLKKSEVVDDKVLDKVLDEAGVPAQMELRNKVKDLWLTSDEFSKDRENKTPVSFENLIQGLGQEEGSQVDQQALKTEEVNKVEVPSTSFESLTKDDAEADKKSDQESEPALDFSESTSQLEPGSLADNIERANSIQGLLDVLRSQEKELNEKLFEKIDDNIDSKKLSANLQEVSDRANDRLSLEANIVGAWQEAIAVVRESKVKGERIDVNYTIDKILDKHSVPENAGVRDKVKELILVNLENQGLYILSPEEKSKNKEKRVEPSAVDIKNAASLKELLKAVQEFGGGFADGEKRYTKVQVSLSIELGNKAINAAIVAAIESGKPIKNPQEIFDQAGVPVAGGVRNKMLELFRKKFDHVWNSDVAEAKSFRQLFKVIKSLDKTSDNKFDYDSARIIAMIKDLRQSAKNKKKKSVFSVYDLPAYAGIRVKVSDLLDQE